MVVIPRYGLEVLNRNLMEFMRPYLGLHTQDMGCTWTNLLWVGIDSIYTENHNGATKSTSKVVVFNFRVNVRPERPSFCMSTDSISARSAANITVTRLNKKTQFIFYISFWPRMSSILAIKSTELIYVHKIVRILEALKTTSNASQHFIH